MSSSAPVKSAELSSTSETEEDKLPHLYGFPWYKWAREFFESTNTHNFICAANQISKSSTMIRKAIHWATETDLWPKLWKNKPTQFWYFYPDKGTATREFKEKWVKEFLPKNKDDEKYGWKEVWGERRTIHSIEFKSGVTIYFMVYTQLLTNIQASSVYAMFCDEECPDDVYDEVFPRVWATGGYFHQVFTATLGLETWRRTIEEKGDKELFPNAFKRQVSMYDCTTYEDGSPSPWTKEKVKAIEESCRNDAERLRRVYGRFILSTNQAFSAFEESKHLIRRTTGGAGWRLFAGVYKSCICLVRVNEAFDRAEIVDGWMAEDHEADPSALDVYMQYRKLTKGKYVSYAYADKKHSKDFAAVANSGGSPFHLVKKPKDNGEKLINSLFQTKMLKIVDRASLKNLILQIKSTLRDDEELLKHNFVGAFITVISNLSWNFEHVLDRKEPEKDPLEDMHPRLKFYRGLDRPSQSNDTYDNELESISEEYHDEYDAAF